MRTIPPVPLPELLKAYKKDRLRPVGKSDWNNIVTVFGILLTLYPHATTASPGEGVTWAEALEYLQWHLVRMKNRQNRPYCRKHINKLIGFVRSVFNWGAGKDCRPKLVAYSVAAELKIVPDLRYGEALHENPEREEASPTAIIAAIRHIKEQQIIDMLILLVLTGMRPSELCNLKSGEIRKKTGKTGKIIWKFIPFHHKTEWKGKKRSITLGEEEMAILQKYLPGKNAHDPVFCNLHRRKSSAISENRFAKIIRETQEKHGLERFTPYQVRHTNGTWIGTILDRDHARAQLGHTTEKTTGIYVHVDEAKQEAIIEKRKAVGSLLGDVFPLIGVPQGSPTPTPTYPHIIKFPGI